MATDASDVDGKRREVTDATHYHVLETVSRWRQRLELVERVNTKPHSDRVASDFGDLTR